MTTELTKMIEDRANQIHIIVFGYPLATPRNLLDSRSIYDAYIRVAKDCLALEIRARIEGMRDGITLSCASSPKISENLKNKLRILEAQLEQMEE